MTKFNFTLIVVAMLSMFTMVACGDDAADEECAGTLETVECDAETDEECSEDGTKDVCIEDEGLNCADDEVEGTDADGNPACVPAEEGCADGEEEVSVDCDAATDEECGEDGTKLVCQVPESVRFVLIQDVSNLDPNSTYPGLDLDAVELIKGSDDSSHYANDVLDFMTYSDSAIDADAALGAPDATAGAPDCGDVDPTLFFAMGHDDTEGGGFIIVSFENDAIIESGDEIVVHEFGTQCGDQYSDDTYDVSVSTASDIDGTWTSLCQGTGLDSCLVP